MRYMVCFGYDGSKFHGFQRQKNVRNVQEEIEKILSDVLKETVVIKGSGRTDAKVHAIKQYAHFDFKRKLSSKEKKDIKNRINEILIFNSIKRISDDTHARFSVKKKKYIYKINVGNFNKDYINYFYQPKLYIDKNKLLEVKDLFIGQHDFHNFVSGKRDDYNTIIYKINIKEKNDILTIEFIGAGFYRYMVRNIVGALLDYTKDKVSKDDLRKMLNDINFNKQLTTAPADGLYLVNVYY